MNSLPVHHTPAPTSSSSPLPDDAHPSDRTEPTRTPRQRYFDGKKLCNRIVIFAVLILVFAVCVSFAIRHWNPVRLSSKHFFPPFVCLSKCTHADHSLTLKSLFDPRPQSKSNRRQRWERASCQMGKRPEKKQANPGIPSSFFLVTNVTLNPPIHEDKPDEQFEAFWGRDNERYNETFIDKKIETLDPDSSTRCWRTDSTPFSVSFRKIENDSTAPPATAWAAIFIAAVDAIFIITALSALFHDRGSHDQQNHTPRRNVTPPDPAKSQYLSVQQTKFVLHKFAHEASVSDLDPDWVCSICLEDDQQDDDIPIRTTILPCNHRFHRL